MKNGACIESDQKRGFGADVSMLSSMLFLAQVSTEFKTSSPNNVYTYFAHILLADSGILHRQRNRRAWHNNSGDLLGQYILISRRNCCKPGATHGAIALGRRGSVNLAELVSVVG